MRGPRQSGDEVYADGDRQDANEVAQLDMLAKEKPSKEDAEWRHEEVIGTGGNRADYG